MATANSNKSKTRYGKKRATVRDALWPNLDTRDLWNRLERDGYSTIPRTLSLVGRILDGLSSGQPLSRVYHDLWCLMTDESLVEVENEADRAFACGFSGQRAVYTWRDRMKKLVDLGFIEAHRGSRGPYSFVLVFNPHLVIGAMRRDDPSSIPTDDYIALVDKLTKIGANDLDDLEE